MKPFEPKARHCEVCQTLYTPQRMGQVVCRPACAMKKVRLAKVEERAKIKTRKQAAKTIPVLIREAQVAFNAYIRERDRQAGHVCISSGRPLDWTGNAVDAGHYRSTGAAPHLRFNEDNCHAQSKQENRFLAGNAIDYRVGLIARIGLACVEALEADNTVKKWTREELTEIRDHYRKLLKEMT